MSSSLDVSVLPIYRQDGYDQSYLPGLQVAAPPRGPARGRRNDRLIVFFSIEGGSQISPSLHSQILENLTKGFYKTSGTATTAMSTLVKNLNDYLFKRNRSASGRGRQVVALLTLVVVREDHLYLAQCGPVHGLLLTATGIRHLHDAESAGRGLGISQNPSVRFSQASFASNDLLILTPNMPEGWNENTFQAGFIQDIPTLRRRLLADAGSDLTTVLLMAHHGSGQIQLLTSPDSLSSLYGAPAQQSLAQKAAAAISTSPPQHPPPAPQPEKSTVISEVEPISSPPTEIPTAELPTSSVVSTSPVEPPESDLTPSPTGIPPQISKVTLVIQNAGRGAIAFIGKITGAVGALFGRMLPEDTELRLSSSAMAFIAIAVPMVVVAVSAVVYLRIGQQTQYESNYEQALVIVDYANILNEPGELLEAWASALVWIDQAEQYRVTDESQTLRTQVLLALDELEGVTRLDFEPALLGSLNSSVSITRMLATGSDLYLLDANDGAVIHTTVTGSGQYILDTDFRCGPGQYGQHIVVKLVDIAALPRPDPSGATIVAIDSNGILLYCSPDDTPIASALIPPDNNWGSPRAITIQNGNLYVLDPMVNAVWIFFGEDFLFDQPPRFFFAEQVPSIQDSIDIALDGDDLYLLQANGGMIKCTFSDIPEAPTTCQDPAIYATSPTGEASIPMTGNFAFTQMAHTAPPEPSIFLLDASGQSVYHFSLRLNLAAQYRSASVLPEGDIDAFAVSPNRALFIAFGNQIFVAFLR